MNRSSFLKYISQDYDKKGAFLAGEINEFVLMVYNIMVWAIRDDSATIKVTPNQVTWLRQGEVLGHLPTPMSFKPSFQLVIKRDPLVRSHLTVLSDRVDTIEYKLEFTSEDDSS